MSLSSIFERLPREIANTHPDGWVVGIREARLARILRPYERPLIEALAAHLGGSVCYEKDGAACVITLRTHDGFVDDHVKARARVSVRYVFKTGQWTSDVASSWTSGFPGLASHLWRLSAPSGNDDRTQKLCALIGAACVRMAERAGRSGENSVGGAR